MADIREIRDAMKRKRRARTVRRIAVVIILLALIAAVIIGGDKLSPEAISQWLASKTGQTAEGEGFPVSLPSGEVVSINAVQNNIVVTNQTNVYFYSPRGKQLRSVQHARKNVQTKTAGENALVYSVGGEEISVETYTKTITSFKAGKPIITAEISKNGRFAVATESDVYTSEMTVYDKNGNAVFKWTPSGSVITALAISNDGHFVAAATVFTQGGKMMSGIHLFQTSKENALFSYTAENEMVLALFCERNSVNAVCTEKLISLDGDGAENNVYSYNEKKLIDYKPCDEGIAFVFQDVNDPSRSVLEIISLEGSLKAEAKISYAIKALAAHDGDIYAASDEHLLKYESSTAIKRADIELSEDAGKISATSAGAYITDASGKLLRPELN